MTLKLHSYKSLLFPLIVHKLGMVWDWSPPSPWVALSCLDVDFFFPKSIGEEKRLVHTSDVTVVINCTVDRTISPMEIFHGNSHHRQLFQHHSGLLES